MDKWDSVSEQLGMGASQGHKPTMEEVDDLADKLVQEYDTPDYRKWYCTVIYTLGVDRVLRLQFRARSGVYPGKIFSRAAKQAMSIVPRWERYGFQRADPETSGANSADNHELNKIDQVYIPRDEELTKESIEQMLLSTTEQSEVDRNHKGRGIDPFANS